MFIVAKAVMPLLAAMMALPALAQEPQSAPSLQTASLPVYLCESSDANRSAFLRQHGEPPTFVTAEEILAARTAGERWETPRCMTDRQHRRLGQMTATLASR